jgi:hypothetical protein
MIRPFEACALLAVGGGALVSCLQVRRAVARGVVDRDRLVEISNAKSVFIE